MLPDSLPQWMDDVFLHFSPKTAITFLRNGAIETELTYGRLKQDIDRLAAFINGRGLKKGDRVILLLEKSIIAVVVHLALQKLGLICVPLNPGFKTAELDYLLTDADPGLILADPERTKDLKRLKPDCPLIPMDTQKPYQMLDLPAAASPLPGIAVGPQDPGLIIYTSGTTGDPKGALLTQKNLVHDAANIIDIWQINQNDLLCHALPLFHVHGLCFALHTILLAGAGIVMLDRFNAQQVIDVLASQRTKKRCTLFMAVPVMYTTLLDIMEKKPRDLTHLRLITSGSAPLLPKEFARIESFFGQKPVEREGMTETGMNFSNPIDGDRRPGSVGLPLPGLSVRIVDPDTFIDMTPGEIGEIWLKSEAITPGYFRKPVETGRAFKDGWFRSGDLGCSDTDGYYYITDRIKHIIISGGENVSAKEVETVINQIDGVAEAAVVGLPDQKWGEIVAAAVVLKPRSDVSAAAITAFCKERLHDWKCPKKIHFIRQIPKNTMGKVLKEPLKNRLMSMNP